MFTLIKLVAAALISLAVLSPSFSPRVDDDASCACKADADT